VLDATRSPDLTPHVGLTVLSEVALRALSPAVDEPGNTTVVISALTKLVVAADRATAPQETEAKASRKHDPDPNPDLKAEPAGIEFGRLTLPEFAIRTVATDGFSLIARASFSVSVSVSVSVSMLEVGIRLQKMLVLLARNNRTPVALEARLQAHRTVARGMAALSQPDDRRQLEALYQQLFSA
jgi:uncharacterized membrane protein